MRNHNLNKPEKDTDSDIFSNKSNETLQQEKFDQK